MSAVMAAVAQPGLWGEAMAEVARFFGGVGALAEFHTDDHRQFVIGPRGGFIDQRMVEIYLEHYAATCPRPMRLMRPGVAAVQTEAMIGSESELDRHPFYVDFLQPAGLRYHLALRLGRRGGAVGALAVHRLAKDGDSSEDDIAWMYALAPFLRDAFAAHAVLGETEVGDDGLIGALARLDTAVVFLSAEGKVLFQNTPAALLLARERPPDWPAMLRRCIEARGRDEDGALPPLRSVEGGWIGRLLEFHRTIDPRTTRGVYAVLLEPGTDAPMARRRGLTPTEAAVLALLLAGLSPAEIAVRQAVTLATVRTHLARLHEKFGVHRTLDVVRIALREGFAPER